MGIGQIQANQEATVVLKELSLAGPVVHIAGSLKRWHSNG